MNKLKPTKKRVILLFSMAVIAALLWTAFPLNIERGQPDASFQLGVGEYTITIGNLASAADTADYTCDGTDDDETFQTAVDALPATGGQLFVLAGTYNWGATDTVTRAIDNISIVGIGAAVLFDGDDSTPLFEAGGNDWLFAHLEVDAGDITMGATTDWMWINVKVDTTKYTLRTADISIIDGNFHLGNTDTTLVRASAGDVNIEGNIIYRAGGTDVPLTDGGTGSSTASGARTNLGLAIGCDVQAYDAQLADIAGLAVTDSNFIVADGANWVAESGATARTSLGLGNVENTALSTWTGSANIATVGTVGTGTWAATDVAVAAGGTGASTASAARTNLGLAIGSDVQAYDAGLADIAGLAVTDSNIIVGDGANWVAETGATARTSLGLAIGTDVAAQTHASQHAVGGADAVFPADPNDDWYLMWDDAPTGEIVWAAVAGSGTVDTSGTPVANDYARFTDADTIEGRDYGEVRGDLGLVIGTNVQAWDTELDDIAALSDADSNFIVGSAGGWVAESGATVRTSLGLTIGSDVQAYDAQLADIAGLAVTDSNFIVGDGANWVAETGATVRTSLGLGTGDSPQFTGIELGHASDSTVTRISAGVLAIEGSNILKESDVDATPSDGDTADPISSDWAYDDSIVTITFVIDGGGSAITTGEKGHMEIPFDCTLTGWTLMADQSGAIQIDIWDDTYANFPPTDADTMPGAGAEPEITASGQKAEDNAITDWTDYTLSANEIIAFNVDSCTTIERIVLSLTARKT